MVVLPEVVVLDVVPAVVPCVVVAVAKIEGAKKVVRKMLDRGHMTIDVEKRVKTYLWKLW